ncbi:MAG: response regulator [bacterium]|nr:response regulator [bacterium]
MRVLFAVTGISLIPLLLIHAGFRFGAAASSQSGSQFASWLSPNFSIQLDTNALALIILISVFSVLHNRLRYSPFVSMLGTTMVIAGLVDAIHIFPINPSTLATQAIPHSIIPSRMGSALILLTGPLALYFSKILKPIGARKSLLICASVLGIGTWWVTSSGSSLQHLSPNLLHILTMSTYFVIGTILSLSLKQRPATLLGQFTRAALIPLFAGQLYLVFASHIPGEQAFHAATTLKWVAWLLPTIGLGIDTISTFHGLGLNQEKQFLRSVIDTIPHFIFARDKDGRFTLVNKSVADFYDLPVDQVEGQLLQDIHPNQEQCRMWLDEDKTLLKNGRRMELPETTTTNSEGKTVWINATKKLLSASRYEKAQVLGVTIDISRQKNAEQALSERLKYEQASTAIVQAFVHTNSENLQDTMDRILQHLGFYIEADRCFIYRFCQPNQDARLLFSWLRAGQDKNTKLPISLNHIGMEWMTHWFALNMPVAVDHLSDLPESAQRFLNQWNIPEETSFLAMPIMQNNEVMGFLGIDCIEGQGWNQETTNLVRYVADMFMTVWSKLEAERSLLDAMQEAQASSRAKSEFLANMSHEIRTPMNCVIGISDLLMEMNPTDQQCQYLDMISQSGSALLALINDILDLSKIEAGQLELDPIEMNLRSLVEEVTGLIAFTTQAKGVQVVARIAPGAPDKVVCDPNRLRQVLTNLLNNAAKFTAEGHIYLNVEPIGGNEKQVNLKFQITDTGIGIDPKKLKAIFEKFTQADASTTRRFGGTGLGLPISQHLVTQMGGKITAESTLGKGTVFSFALPLQVVEESQNKANTLEEKDECILVITEHELSGEVLAEQVRSLGYRCSVAFGCNDAIDLMPGPPGSAWSHILLDQDLVNNDAPVIRDYLKNQSSGEPAKLIMLTALSGTIPKQELSHRGFSATLPKPVRPHQLEAVLENRPYVTGAEASLPKEPKHTEEKLDKKIDGPQILVAEDNPFNQKVALGMFNLLGCQVEVANDGIEAVAKVSENDYDIIFMDCQMPNMDGYEATRAIRALEDKGRASTTIIAMTANALSGDKRTCYEAGMNDFLSKPINKTMLADMLSKWSQAKQPV